MITHPVLVPCPTRHPLCLSILPLFPTIFFENNAVGICCQLIELKRPRSQSYTAACTCCRLRLLLWFLSSSSSLPSNHRYSYSQNQTSPPPLHQSQRPSFQPVLQRSSQREQSNWGLPSFLFTSLCARQSHWENSSREFTCGFCRAM